MEDPPERRWLRLLVAVLLLALGGDETAGVVPELWSDSPEASAVARHRGARSISASVLPDVAAPGPAPLPPPVQGASEAALPISSPGAPYARRVLPGAVPGAPPRTRAPPA